MRAPVTLGRWMLVAAAIVVGLAVAEGLARIVLPPPQIVRIASGPGGGTPPGPPETPPPRAFRMPESGGWREVFVQTPTGRRLRPNLRVLVENHRLSHRDIELRTNSLGFRGGEPGPKTRTRVLFLGDSITLAHYLPEEETFVHLVGALSAADGAPLETINGAVAAAGLESAIAILHDPGLRTDSDIVVLGFYLNDVQPSPGVMVTQPSPLLAWSRVARYALEGIALLGAAAAPEETAIRAEEWRAWREQVEREFPPGPGDPARDPSAFNRLVLDSFEDWGSAWSDGAWDRMRPLFEEFRRLADRHRFVPCVVAFPHRAQVDAAFVNDRPQRRLRAVCDRAGIRMLDLLPHLRGIRARAEGPLFYDGCHHTPLGSRVVAAEILRFLRTLPAPAGPPPEVP